MVIDASAGLEGSLACRIWGSNPPQYSPHQNTNGHQSLGSKPLLQHKLKTIEKVEDLTSTFSNTFLASAEDGSLDINHKMVPSLADAVLQKLGDALAQQQVSMASIACGSAFPAEAHMLVLCSREEASCVLEYAMAYLLSFSPQGDHLTHDMETCIPALPFSIHLTWLSPGNTKKHSR